MITPEIVTVSGAILAATVTAGPAYIAARRARGAARAEGEASREAARVEGEATREAARETINHSLDIAVARLSERIDAYQSAARDDITEMRTDIREIREWTAGHTTEHILINHRRDSN